MNKFIMNPNIKKEAFPDGDTMFYDDLTEVVHIFNQTATLIAELIELNDYEAAKTKYISSFLSIDSDDNSRKVMENDFDNIVKELIQKGIIVDTTAI